MTNNYFKNKIGLDFILLVILVINFVFTVEKWHYIKYIPVSINQPVNFIYFYISFAFIVFYFFIDHIKMSENRNYYLKVTSVIILIIFLVGSFCIYQITLRKMGAGISFTHDGAIQTEQAVNFLDQGKNPYAENYKNTVFGQYIDQYSGGKRENPAWYHYVYLPFYVLFSWPFYKISTFYFSFFDERMVHFFVFFLSLFIIYKLPENRNKKIIGLLLFAFNPIFFPWLAHGYNDIFVFFWLILGLYLLKLNRFFWSAVSIALACASKQQAWLILPFYFFYLYFQEDRTKDFIHKLLNVIKRLMPFIVTSLVIFLPFLIWGFNDFVDDIYRYPSGTIATNFPLVGYGISHIIYLVGAVKSIWDYFPLWIFQLIFGLPLLYFILKKQKKNNSLSQLLINYGLFLFVFWFFARYFHDSHVSYISLIFLSAYLIEEKSQTKTEKLD